MQIGLFELVVLGAIAALVGFLIFYFRDYIPIFQTGPRKTEVDAQIEALLDNIRQLARSHEYNKAGLLVWSTFAVAAGGFLGMERAPAQTARAFALSMLSYDDVSLETVEPVYELFEKSRYDISEVSLQDFNAGLTGLHRYLRVANQISSQVMGGVTQEGEEADGEEIVGGEGEEDDDDWDDDE